MARYGWNAQVAEQHAHAQDKAKKHHQRVVLKVDSKQLAESIAKYVQQRSTSTK